MSDAGAGFRQLIDRDRVSSLLTKAGIDALVLTEPENAYYASGIWPPLANMGLRDAAIVVVPRNRADPVAYVTNQYTFYLGIADSLWGNEVEPYLVTKADNTGIALPSTYRLNEHAELTDRERNRRNCIEAIPRFHASTDVAVVAALKERGVLQGRLGFDSLSSSMLIERLAPMASSRDARDVVKHLRLVKSGAEIDLMRIASAANVQAALATAQKMRNLGSIKKVRSEFFEQAIHFGNSPQFMSVNGAINEHYDEELTDGTAVLIDCVSHFKGYHGDYGRTIFIGDPPRGIRNALEAITTAWQELRLLLRPGLSFSQISSMGQEILSKIGDFQVPFGPHSVGLAHTDQPFSDLLGNPIDVTLEAGMIISVDCPLLHSDPGGTIHIEDLMLITADGAEAIHDTSTKLITV